MAVLLISGSPEAFILNTELSFLIWAQREAQTPRQFSGFSITLAGIPHVLKAGTQNPKLSGAVPVGMKIVAHTLKPLVTIESHQYGIARLIYTLTDPNTTWVPTTLLLFAGSFFRSISQRNAMFKSGGHGLEKLFFTW